LVYNFCLSSVCSVDGDIVIIDLQYKFMHTL